MKLSIGKAWEEASAFLAREGRLVAPVALALFALPSTLVNWAFPGEGATGGNGLGGVLLMLLVLLVVMVGQMTIVLLSIGWNGKLADALRQAVRRIGALLAASLIVFLPLAVAAVLALGFILATNGLTDPAQLTPETLAQMPAVRWVLVLLVVVLIVIGTRVFPLSAVAASEPGGPFSLLKRTFALTKGNFWRLLALLLLIGTAGAIADRAVTSVVGSISVLAVGEIRALSLSALLVALASGVVGALVSSVSAAMIGRVYVQLSRTSGTAAA
ncbi:MAG: hypothetical protein ABIN83_04420 [Sphingomicrobium sp.]